jgi:hypothetical protein
VKAFGEAFEIAQKFQDEYVSTEHLLLALADARGTAAQKALAAAGATEAALLAALKEVRGSSRVTDQNPEDKFQALKKYARDLTEAARKGKLDPVIGRNDEIRRIIQVLSRRTKNNPVLIGEPGVGKTAIVEGLALRIRSGDVPEGLKNKSAFRSISRAHRGRQSRAVRDRLKALLKEVESRGRVILHRRLHTPSAPAPRPMTLEHVEARAARSPRDRGDDPERIPEVHRRTPPSNGDSSRCTSKSPRSRTRSRSSGASGTPRGPPACVTDAAIVAAATLCTATSPTGSFPTRRSTDRRGRVGPAHRDRLADRDRDRAPHRPARDREARPPGETPPRARAEGDRKSLRGKGETRG